MFALRSSGTSAQHTLLQTRMLAYRPPKLDKHGPHTLLDAIGHAAIRTNLKDFVIQKQQTNRRIRQLAQKESQGQIPLYKYPNERYVMWPVVAQNESKTPACPHVMECVAVANLMDELGYDVHVGLQFWNEKLDVNTTLDWLDVSLTLSGLTAWTRPATSCPLTCTSNCGSNLWLASLLSSSV